MSRYIITDGNKVWVKPTLFDARKFAKRIAKHTTSKIVIAKPNLSILETFTYSPKKKIVVRRKKNRR